MITILLLIVFNGILGLEVELEMPEAVGAGSSPTLHCRYSLAPAEVLYSVKWYRGTHEFFRYLPAATPHIAAFPAAGIQVDLHGSGADKVKLINVPTNISGKVECEVSIEGSFKTITDSRNLTIVDLDVRKPILNLSSDVFDPNDDLRIVCTAEVTEPPPLINFYIDYTKINRSYVTDYGNGTAVLDRSALVELTGRRQEGVSPVWLRCAALLRGVYHRASAPLPLIPLSTTSKHCRQTVGWSPSSLDVLRVRLAENNSGYSGSPRNTFSFIVLVCLNMLVIFLKSLYVLNHY